MRKTYSREFKIKVCKEISSSKATVSSISKDFNITRTIVSRWVSEYKRYKDKAFSGKGNKLPDKAKLYILQKELERVKMENEILKKFEEFVKREKK